MNIKNLKNETNSYFYSDPNINLKEKDSKTCQKAKKIKSNKKKVKFKSHFIKIINIESYKKYNGDNEPKIIQNFQLPKYKETHCVCFIF